jgi:hypothetical protein
MVEIIVDGQDNGYIEFNIGFVETGFLPGSII